MNNYLFGLKLEDSMDIELEIKADDILGALSKINDSGMLRGIETSHVTTLTIRVIHETKSKGVHGKGADTG